MGTRILLVEDDDDSREALKHLVACEGHRVTAVASAEAAVDALRSLRFDAVLTDCFANFDGRRSGAEQVLHAAGPTPVIAHTGWPIDTDEAVRRGFADVLRKPADIDRLFNALARAARDRSLAR